ncbi:hypothetical protein B0I35DRAFT_501667 [Stachybotrys elegans]|uniref:NACHT-NTPase and P-loop NTPases N-terminal domain-containing protein n=1 Tax=Stachybotrys elegans TaxID=80388 RepID=A0A8K0WJD8_9HYPO|nr:hypothetical protein B0I35DRAFT_501667 [Stachybotrys elegans]
MDPLSLVMASIGLVQTISSTYRAIQHIKGLPKAFQSVSDDLPLVEAILKSARDELSRQNSLAEDVKRSINTIIKRCHDNAQKLNTIFEKIKGKEQQESKDGKEWSVTEFYRNTLRSFGRLAKAHKVENLMKDLLQDLKKMALMQIFKTATAAQIEKVEKALLELENVEPSVPDSDFEEGESFRVEQKIASGGKGNQAINKGGEQHNIFGHHIDSGGGSINMGKIPES